MILPQTLREKIIRVFGSKGEQWLARAPELVQELIAGWGLTQVGVSPILSHNLVCFAVSPLHGHVALKIGVPHDELLREMETLRAYDGHLACRMYECDREAVAMLIERILPGTDLWQTRERQERVRVAGQLLRSLPVSAQSASGIPLHREVVRRTFQRVMSLTDLDDVMLKLIRAAEEAECGLYADGVRCDMLLHGDLNHWNILRQGTDQWRVIDPQGFVGPVVLDAGRFVLNEMTYGESPCEERELPGLLAELANLSGTRVRDVWRSALIDAVLSTCWHLEEGAGTERMARHTQVCNSIMRTGKVIF